MSQTHADMIRASCDYSLTLTPDDVASGIEAGRYVPFGNDHAVLIAEIADYPAKGTKICDVVVAGGDLATLNETLRPQVEQWARENNCTHCMVEGRPGWRRAIRQHGYTEHLTNVIKEL